MPVVGRNTARLVAAALLLASACTSAADLRPRETDNAAPLRQATLGTAVPVPAATQSDGPILVSLAENYFVPPLVTFNFTKPGKYRYYCTLHGDMIGEVDVE